MNEIYVSTDVEADGPIPGDYSMVCFGAIVVEPSLTQTFYARLKPISDRWVPEALAVSGFSRNETLEFDDPKALVLAAATAHEAGYRRMDAYSPFPIEELHEVLSKTLTRQPSG